jgi:hypothetical protein
MLFDQNLTLNEEPATISRRMHERTYFTSTCIMSFSANKHAWPIPFDLTLLLISPCSAPTKLPGQSEFYMGP